MLLIESPYDDPHVELRAVLIDRLRLDWIWTYPLISVEMPLELCI